MRWICDVKSCQVGDISIDGYDCNESYVSKTNVSVCLKLNPVLIPIYRFSIDV